MAQVQAAQQVQGLHVLAVVKAARVLAAEIARGGGVSRVNIEAIRESLAALVSQADRLANYERQAVARGEIARNTDGKAVADMLEASAHVLNATREQHEARNLTDEEVKGMFSLDDEQPDEPKTEGDDADDTSMFSVD